MATEWNNAPHPPPVRVCAKCSTQSQTFGDFCPHCGHRYTGRRRRLRRRTAIILTVALVVLGAEVTAIAWKLQHDREEERIAATDARREADRVEAERLEAERAEAEQKQEAAEAKAAARQRARAAQRAQRQELIRQMQASITKDAKDRVARGELEGPIYYTSCDPLGGGSVDDLTALTTTFECLAVYEQLEGGQVRGWVFSSRANWDESSWSWRLGR